MAVFVTHRQVAVNPNVFKTPPVGFEIAFLLPPEAAGHADPRLLDDELPYLAGFYRLSVLIENVDIHSGTRSRERARLNRQQRIAHQNAAGDLGAAGVVDDRGFAVTDFLEQPPPRRGIPGFTGRGEHSQAAEAVALVG